MHPASGVAIAWCLAALGLAGCTRSSAESRSAAESRSPSVAAPEHDHEELATYMGRLQAFSQKLGYAIGGRNPRLAGFYLEELEEGLEEVEREVPVHDGIDLAQLVRTIAKPAVGQLEDALGPAPDWAKAEAGYVGLIEACNRCHAATEHEFIVILPATGAPPFNQRFDAR